MASRAGVKARLAEATLPQRVIERVLSKVVPGDGGCLLSTYSALSEAGYRQVGWSGDGVVHKMLVHRVAWIAEHGPIPDGMTVHHKCFATACVNHEHLGLLPRFENTRRQNGNDWPLGTCQRGHDNSELVRESGQNVRRPCRRESVDRRRKERASADTRKITVAAR